MSQIGWVHKIKHYFGDNDREVTSQELRELSPEDRDELTILINKDDDK